MKLHRVMLHTALLMVALCVAASAQDTGSITGTVTDPSGAAVANAEVSVSNAGQGITRTARTNGGGEYLFAGLPVGNYDLAVTATGFKKYQAKGVVLGVADKSR